MVLRVNAALLTSTLSFESLHFRPVNLKGSFRPLLKFLKQQNIIGYLRNPQLIFSPVPPIISSFHFNKFFLPPCLQPCATSHLPSSQFGLPSHQGTSSLTRLVLSRATSCKRSWAVLAASVQALPSFHHRLQKRKKKYINGYVKSTISQSLSNRRLERCVENLFIAR